jgi:hypothetical protein
MVPAAAGAVVHVRAQHDQDTWDVRRLGGLSRGVFHPLIAKEYYTETTLTVHNNPGLNLIFTEYRCFWYK